MCHHCLFVETRDRILHILHGFFYSEYGKELKKKFIIYASDIMISKLNKFCHMMDQITNRNQT